MYYDNFELRDTLSKVYEKALSNLKAQTIEFSHNGAQLDNMGKTLLELGLTGNNISLTVKFTKKGGKKRSSKKRSSKKRSSKKRRRRMTRKLFALG